METIRNNKAAETILEFNKIKEIWKGYAMTDGAKEAIEGAAPMLSESQVLARLRETTEARDMIQRSGQPPLVSLSGIREWMRLAEIGGCLTAEQLEGMERALAAVDRMKRYLEQGKIHETALAWYGDDLQSCQDLREAIGQQIRGGQVSDHASKALRACRMDIEKEERSMREKAETAIRSGKNMMTDSFSTMRNGHMCVPVKAEYRYRVKGNVIGQSSTGSTVFIEPEACARHYGALEMLRLEEENEVRRILYTLTGMVYDFREELECDIRVMEKLDLMFSRGKLSLAYGGVEPSVNTERRIVLKDGRHPLMDRAVSVPLQFRLGNAAQDGADGEAAVRGIVITGPNTGGKTVAIKTVALNCMMAQTGLHVACREADICMCSGFLCDIGDGQDMSENLSTFSSHIVNVLDILKKVDRDSLVILDELGSGTDPAEGMGIAVAILEELKKSGALFLVTTHYPEVKQYAERAEGMVNARMTFDKESLKPTYRLVIGEAGESCAFYIAGKLGMPEPMLECAARAAYGAPALPEEIRRLAAENRIRKEKTGGIQKRKTGEKGNARKKRFHRGDSVMILPDQKTGIVCEEENEKGVLRVQMPGKKIYINHKRVRLQVAASQLYPEDYDFSIIFDTVESCAMTWTGESWSRERSFWSNNRNKIFRLVRNQKI
mgnify:FL=1